jgi:hypothetical protein
VRSANCVTSGGVAGAAAVAVVSGSPPTGSDPAAVAGPPVAAGGRPVAAGARPVLVAAGAGAAVRNPVVSTGCSGRDRCPAVDRVAAAGTVPASAGLPNQPLVAAAKPRRAAARISAGIKCENIANAGTTSMQLTSSRERSFMVSGRFGDDRTQGPAGDDSGRQAGLQSEIDRKNAAGSRGNTAMPGRLASYSRPTPRGWREARIVQHGLFRKFDVENRHQPVR